MKIFILERGEDGTVYSYIESPEHFAVVGHNPASGRSLQDRVEIETDNECRVDHLLEPGQWTSFVVNEFEFGGMTPESIMNLLVNAKS